MGYRFIFHKFLVKRYRFLLKRRSLDKLDKMHVDVAKNIQGLAPNTPAIVALESMK